MLPILENSARERKTILCFGIDPILEKIKEEGTVEEKILKFYFELTDKLIEENQLSAIKPNYAFFAQYGFEGLSALKNIIERYRGKVLVILDGKRGDIGRTAQAYARELYDFWRADATTVSPYLGSDTIEPFLREGKLAYVLCKTSNPGSAELQDLKFKGKKLYEIIAEKSLNWKNSGLVVGATSDAIKKIVKITKGEVPFLIPGIGTQGGDLDLVMKAIKKNPYIHRINSSSGIAEAYLKSGGTPIEAALKEAEKLNAQMRKYF